MSDALHNGESGSRFFFENAGAAIFDAIKDSVFLLSPDYRILRCNKASYVMFNKAKPDEILGKFCWEILQGSSEKMPTLPIVLMEKTKKRETSVLKSGERLLEITVNPVLDEKNNISGVVHVVSDITERRRTEVKKAELEEQNLQLQKAESLGRMTGAIANIFNNQLHVVSGYLGMVIDDLPPSDSNVMKLTKALQSVKKASEVSGFLTTSLGQIPGKLELLDLSELCLVNLPIFQAGKPKDVELETDLPSPGPIINANAKQIQQLLTNIMINAWESIGDCDGSIQLKVRTVPHTDIPASHRFPVGWRPQDLSYACLEVVDTGCGIQEKDIGKIFDPFFSKKPTGMGLGLSVVLGIASTHNSGITVESKVNCGSIFRVFFPLSLQTETLYKGQVAKAPDLVQAGPVLVAEDEEGVRKMTELALIKSGFTVLLAKDGVEAVEIFRQHNGEISCLLCDLSMPRMGGWETIEALRAIRHDLPVILASGYDEDSGVMVAEHPELPDFYLNKPYDLSKLCDAIEKAMARKREKGLS